MFGDRSLSELLHLPRRDDDPLTRSGAGADRLTCFAEHLWGAVAVSSVEVPVGQPAQDQVPT